MSTIRDLERIGIDVNAQTPAVAASLTFIAEHYLERLTADQIAAAGGHATRTMQEAFRRDLDRTAITIILELRLRAARDILQRGGGPIVIRDVAARVGWAHPGRFSVRYRELFGETPMETLRARARVGQQRVMANP
ncbi:helix-turn-helix transcriptional regulator [Curtobacterium flaccumfaciens]|nr:helix-turn-helix transcriptional regulator [Curtobacterium flaccumfaciens]